MTLDEKSKTEEVEHLDAATREALDEGQRMAEEDTRRWTPEQVRSDARAMAKEWRNTINQRTAA